MQKAEAAVLKTAAQAFVPRTTFPTHQLSLAGFQGHHRKALQSLREIAFRMDYVIELRDSRAPISTINPLFDHVLRGKPKLVLYTKCDLSPLRHSEISKWDPLQDYMRVDCTQSKDANRIFAFLKDKIISSGPAPPLGYHFLITGMPNSGKSTLMNTLRRVGLRDRDLKKAARTGNEPGITRNMSEPVRIKNSPEIFIYDSPGVFVPQVGSSNAMLSLALTKAISSDGIDPVLLADYLLFHINLKYPSGGKYPGEPTNDIDVLLSRLHKMKLQRMKLRSSNKSRVKYPPFDPSTTANEWLSRYKNGKAARVCLDDISVENYDAVCEKMRDMKVDLGPMQNSYLRKRLMS